MNERHMQPGTRVIVRYGADGDAPVCCLGVVVQRAERRDDPLHPIWWVDVYAAGPDGGPLPQMFRAEEILGLAAVGLDHAGRT